MQALNLDKFHASEASSTCEGQPRGIAIRRREAHVPWDAQGSIVVLPLLRSLLHPIGYACRLLQGNNNPQSKQSRSPRQLSRVAFPPQCLARQRAPSLALPRVASSRSHCRPLSRVSGYPPGGLVTRLCTSLWSLCAWMSVCGAIFNNVRSACRSCCFRVTAGRRCDQRDRGPDRCRQIGDSTQAAGEDALLEPVQAIDPAASKGVAIDHLSTRLAVMNRCCRHGQTTRFFTVVL